MYVCAPLAYLVPLEVEKEHWNPVELQLGVVMNHSVSDGTQALVLRKGKKMLLTPEPCLQPRLIVFKFG